MDILSTSAKISSGTWDDMLSKDLCLSYSVHTTNAEVTNILSEAMILLWTTPFHSRLGKTDLVWPDFKIIGPYQNCSKRRCTRQMKRNTDKKVWGQRPRVDRPDRHQLPEQWKTMPDARRLFKSHHWCRMTSWGYEIEWGWLGRRILAAEKNSYLFPVCILASRRVLTSS